MIVLHVLQNEIESTRILFSLLSHNDEDEVTWFPVSVGLSLRYEWVVIAILHTWFNLNLKHPLLEDVPVGGVGVECVWGEGNVACTIYMSFSQSLIIDVQDAS